MYKIYLVFWKEETKWLQKYQLQKYQESFNGGKQREKKKLAYGCQKSSVKEVLKTGRASPIIYIQDQCDRRSFPRAMGSFLMP